MRIARGRVMLAGMAFLLVVVGVSAVVPLPFQAVVRREETVRVDRSYLRCCLLLAKKEVQSELLQSSGLQAITNSSDAAPSTAKPGMGWTDLWTTTQKDGYKTAEDFEVNCLTEIGDVQLNMSQVTKWDRESLWISTFSKEPGKNIVGYRHEMQLIPDGKTTSAKVSLEIGLKLDVPLLFWGIANERLEQSVQTQLQQFVSKLSTTLDPRVSH